MKLKLLSLFVCFLIFSGSFSLYSQTTVLQHDIDWSTHDQNMWGPNGSPFTLDLDINLFSFGFDTAMSFGSISSFLGGQFGAMFDLDTWFQIGSDFTISGFTSGSVDVDYPVSVYLEIPDDDTFCPGEEVTINSSYEVRPGWDLSTHFPTAGIIALTMDFGFDLDLDATVCVFSCTTLPVIDVHVPYDTITIIGLNSQTGVFTYPCYDPTNFPPFAFCNDTILPIVFDNLFGIGLSGSITLPYIETTDYLDSTTDPCHQNLYANGDSTWVELELDVVQFLSAIAGLIPPPQGPAIQQFLQNLSGNLDMGGGFTIYYNLFSAWFDIKSTMQQDFTFEPSVWNQLTFPVPVEFYVTDPGSGSIVSSGNDAMVEFMACHNLTYKWPCQDINTMDIGVTHALTNDFTNHTWDSLSFSFTIQALYFEINFPIFLANSIPEIPELCLTVLPEDSVPDTVSQCMPEIIMPEHAPLAPDIQIIIGPLIDYTWPLGYIPITWFNQTWELEGFHDTIFPPFSMSTSCPGLEIVSLQNTDVLCHGQSTGSATVVIQHGEPPYTYEWSNGFSETTNATTSTADSLSAGIYSITITDSFGCSITDSVEVFNAYPPLSVDITQVDITCVGGSDGSITLNVSGGLPPFTYSWNPGVSNNHAAGGLVAGSYSITITDANNCDTSITLILTELYPLPPVNFYAQPTEGCEPLEVQFFETSPDEGQTYLWIFGDALGFSNIKEPGFVFNHDGIFDVLLTVTSVHGCENSLLMPGYILVHEKPDAQFLATPRYPEIIDPSVYFYNQSSSTYFSDWDFGDGTSSNETSPYHTFPDTGQYLITLIIETEHGCSDTAYSDIFVQDIYTIYFPNAFCPTGDNGSPNQYFKPHGYNIMTEDYHMMIFDRWGQLLFETTTLDEGWDGTFLGNPCKPDTYVFSIKYRDFEGLRHHEIGSVNLIR